MVGGSLEKSAGGGPLARRGNGGSGSALRCIPAGGAAGRGGGIGRPNGGLVGCVGGPVLAWGGGCGVPLSRLSGVTGRASSWPAPGFCTGDGLVAGRGSGGGAAGVPPRSPDGGAAGRGLGWAIPLGGGGKRSGAPPGTSPPVAATGTVACSGGALMRLLKTLFLLRRSALRTTFSSCMTSRSDMGSP